VAEYTKAKETGNNFNNAQQAIEKYLGEPYKKERTGSPTS
jgi:hypothetical protein